MLILKLYWTGPVKAKQPDEGTEEDRGEKRKRDDSSEETEVEDQKQEEKKVCKGFQLSRHIVLQTEGVFGVCVCVFAVREGRSVMISVSVCLLCFSRSCKADRFCLSETW